MTSWCDTQLFQRQCPALSLQCEITYDGKKQKSSISAVKMQSRE